ncbi:hypothetical protein CRE_26820 [Caenorhabditis remanei]|uniref:F-box domain-containing protein n=1 Tax=Caenorhabditis remanei TaxID=31234 RepID=E3NI24_CAERE|nr:hypothetical protein CRE_26820 [Caenorhabditis remanei]
MVYKESGEESELPHILSFYSLRNMSSSSSSRPAPTLDTLPFLPASLIINYLDIDSLYCLADTARVFKEFIEDLKIRTDGYNISIRKGGYEMSLPAVNYTHYYSERDTDYLIDSMLQDYKDFMSLLPRNIDFLRVDPNLNGHFHRFDQECTVLSIGGHPIEYYGQKMENCSSKDLDVLLNSVNFRRGLALNGPKPLITDNQKIFDIDWLQIRNATWITSEFLKKLKNKIVFLMDTDALTEEQINQYLKDLKSGSIDKQNLQVIGFSRGTLWNKEQVLSGLNSVKAVDQIYKVADFDKRIQTELFLPKVSSDGDIKIEESFDFTRDDGVKVSVEFGRRTVRIYIWNQNQEKKVTKKRGHPEDINGPAAKKSC